VHRDVEVVLVTVELRPLLAVLQVLNDELVQLELLAELLELRLAGLLAVDPQQAICPDFWERIELDRFAVLDTVLVSPGSDHGAEPTQVRSRDGC
jgi:hypothetical protein